MELVLWVLLVTTPHAGTKILGATPEEAICQQAVIEMQTIMKGEKYSTAECIAYVPRDKK